MGPRAQDMGHVSIMVIVFEQFKFAEYDVDDGILIRDYKIKPRDREWFRCSQKFEYT